MTPKLSVVVGYNMARELPRTIRSLSPSMQRDIDAADYEVILVDNGSTLPFDEAACRRLIPNLNGGIATNVMESAAPFGLEYRRIRGTRYQRPTGWPLFVGRLNVHALENMRKSLRLLEREVQETSGSPE